MFIKLQRSKALDMKTPNAFNDVKESDITQEDKDMLFPNLSSEANGRTNAGAATRLFILLEPQIQARDLGQFSASEALFDLQLS